jgi:hypothetical protein
MLLSSSLEHDALYMHTLRFPFTHKTHTGFVTLVSSSQQIYFYFYFSFYTQNTDTGFVLSADLHPGCTSPTFPQSVRLVAVVLRDDACNACRCFVTVLNDSTLYGKPVLKRSTCEVPCL